MLIRKRKNLKGFTSTSQVKYFNLNMIPEKTEMFTQTKYFEDFKIHEIQIKT